DDVLALGVVTIPMAKPPMAPARMPITANTRALSTKVGFPRFSIDLLLLRSNAPSKGTLLSVPRRGRERKLPRRAKITYNSCFHYRDSKGCTAVMAQQCDICGKKPQSGNRISHAHNVTKRRWNVNLRPVHARVGATTKRMRVCTACIRSGKVVKA